MRVVGSLGALWKGTSPNSAHFWTPSAPGRKGTDILYDKFRNGFAHNRGPKSNFVIVQDHEVEGHWAGRFPDLDGKPVGINVDRLAKELLKLLDQLEHGRRRERRSKGGL